tara:strand:+ start:949 stop:1209 length:261 start_codon:yes stop_codon:yes gene_type:complete
MIRDSKNRLIDFDALRKAQKGTSTDEIEKPKRVASTGFTPPAPTNKKPKSESKNRSTPKRKASPSSKASNDEQDAAKEILKDLKKD